MKGWTACARRWASPIIGGMLALAGSAVGGTDPATTRRAAPAARTGQDDRGLAPAARTGQDDRGLAPAARTGQDDRGPAPAARTGQDDRGLAPAARADETARLGAVVRAPGASPVTPARRTAGWRPRLGPGKTTAGWRPRLGPDKTTAGWRPRLGPDKSGMALARLRVAGVAPEGTITFDARDSDRVRSGDTVVIVAQAAPIAVGTLTARPGARPAAKVDWMAAAPVATGDAPWRAAGLEAVVVPRDASARLRERLSADGTLWSVVSEVASDGGTCRIDARPNDGFLPGDRLWALRGGLPIAQVEVERIDPRRGAAAGVTRLVGNAAIATGDAVRLAHAPAALRAGRLKSLVLRVDPHGEEQEVWFPLDPRDGAAAGDRFEVEEDGAYVGLIELREYRGPFAVGLATVALGRRPVRVGDAVRRRDPRDVARGTAALRVFRAEDGYFLVNGGEVDGLAVGQRLLSYPGGLLAAVLRVNTVKVDFCGATIESNPGPDEAPQRGPAQAAAARLEPFCEVRVRPPPLPRRAAGRLSHVTAGGRVGVLEATHADPVAAGEIIEWEGRAGSSGMVIDATARRVLVYFGASWVYPGGIESGTTAFVADETTD